jgi:hypothetical protein
VPISQGRRLGHQITFSKARVHVRTAASATGKTRFSLLFVGLDRPMSAGVSIAKCHDTATQFFTVISQCHFVIVWGLL